MIERVDPGHETFFRGLNQKIRTRWSLRARGTGETVDLMCECADFGCFATLKVPLSEFDRIKSDRRRFIVSPGHTYSKFESVVETHDDYVVVQKTRVPDSSAG